MWLFPTDYYITRIMVALVGHVMAERNLTTNKLIKCLIKILND